MITWDFSFCLDLKCAKLRTKKNYLMEGVSQVMTSEEDVEKSGLVTEYWKFLCVLNLPAITIDCWLLWQFFIRRVSPPGVSYGSGSYWLGSATGVPKEKRGFALWNAERRSIPVQVSGFWKHRCTETVLSLFFSLLLLIWPSEFSNRFKRKRWRVSRETFGHHRRTEFLWPTLPCN